MSEKKLEITEGTKLLRLEVIMSQAIEDDFAKSFMTKATGNMFTKIENVMGKGFSVPKMGDDIWPQFNCLYIIYCTEEQAQQVQEILQELRKEYPGEGLACFRTEAVVM